MTVTGEPTRLPTSSTHGLEGHEPFELDELELFEPPDVSPYRYRQTRSWVVRRALLAADLIGLATAFALAQFLLGSGMAPKDRIDAIGELYLFLGTLPVWILSARAFGLYDRDEERANHSTVDDVVGVLHLVTIGGWLLLAGAWLTELANPTVPKLMTFWALATSLVITGRVAARALCRRRSSYRQNTVIVGTGTTAQLVARKLSKHPEYGMNLVGFVDAPGTGGNGAGARVLGTVDELPWIVQALEVERVVVAFPRQPDQQTLQVLRRLRLFPVQIDIVPRFFQILSSNGDVHALEGLPLVGLRRFRLSRFDRLVKRTADLVLSCLALLLLAPGLGVIAVLIKLDSRGPVIFKQVRMGMGERTFRMYKFRTMVEGADALKPRLSHLNLHASPGGDPRMFKVADDPRVTRVGRVLRRYSLDELPQFFNVVRGEMSLVGPRPLILDEDSEVRHWGRRRLSFMPGITGPWQVLGRSQIPFHEMLSLDYLYVTEWSLFGDLKWIIRTVPALFRVRDAY
jgi:exopolysaccharide biosynthesis polyprenyl glycosylphosphotransferase